MANRVFQVYFIVGMTILLASCTTAGRSSTSWFPLYENCILPEHLKELQFAKDWVLENRSYGKRPIRYCITVNSTSITVAFIPGYDSISGSESYFLNEGGKLLFDSNGNFLRYIAGI